MGKVASTAADMFLRSLDGAVETAPESQEAANDVEAPPQSKAQRPAAETLSQTARRPWQILERVQKGFEIPIVITTSWFVEPGICRFERLGKGVVVNAVWLAYFWAKEEGSSEVATALEGLILDWPFQFIHIQGSSWVEIEQKKCKWRVDDMADCHSTVLRNESIEPSVWRLEQLGFTKEDTTEDENDEKMEEKKEEDTKDEKKVGEQGGKRKKQRLPQCVLRDGVGIEPKKKKHKTAKA